MVNDFDITAIRKQLDAMRRKAGADTPIGHRCSNMIERLDIYPTIIDRDHKKRMEDEIMADRAITKKSWRALCAAATLTVKTRLESHRSGRW